jgi:hypothetical protein
VAGNTPRKKPGGYILFAASCQMGRFTCRKLTTACRFVRQADASHLSLARGSPRGWQEVSTIVYSIHGGQNPTGAISEGRDPSRNSAGQSRSDFQIPAARRPAPALAALRPLTVAAWLAAGCVLAARLACCFAGPPPCCFGTTLLRNHCASAACPGCWATFPTRIFGE